MEVTADTHSSTPNRRSNVWRFLAYVKPYRYQLLLATLAGMLKYNLPVIFPWLLKEFVDGLVSGRQAALGLGTNGLMLLALGLFVVHGAIVYLRTYLADRLAQLMTLDVRRDLFRHILRLPMTFFHSHPTGLIASRLITDVTMAQNFIGVAGINFFMEISSVVAIMAILLTMNSKLAGVALGSLPIYIMVHKWLGSRIRAYSKEARRQMEIIEGGVQESLTGVAEIKCYAREDLQTEQFMERCDAFLAAAMSRIHANATLLAATALLTRIPTVLVIWVGGIMVWRKELSVGELMAFFAYLEMIHNPLTRLSDLNVLLANSLAAIDRLFEFFDRPVEMSVAASGAIRLAMPTRTDWPSPRGEIEFDRVEFHYQAERPLLQDINLRIAPGERVALVGGSGAGKSTIVRLICRLHDPSAGQIRMEGHDIRAFDLATLRARIAIVPQEPALFSGTILDNIRLGSEEAEFDHVIEAARRANALSFIESLPGGFCAEVGERGGRLSGGQRQRISLARAFLKDAPILVLDESTSQLDACAERLVHEGLERLMDGRTTVVISHRLSTLAHVDRMVVLAGGRIVQDGRHAELMKDHYGEYARLFTGQPSRVDGYSLLAAG